MPLNSGLNLNSGLSGVRPRPSGGIGLARPVASTSSIMAPSAAPVAPRPEPLAPPKAAPKPQPVQQQASSGGGGEMNAFSKIGLLLSNVAAGMEGRPLPSRQIEENRLKREEMEMRKTAAKIEAIAAVGTIAGKVPGGNSDAVKTGLIEALGGDQDGFVDAMFAAPQIDEQMYGIAAPALASIYQTGGRELFMDTISSPERMKAIADREIASAREPANAKMEQIFGLLQKGAASGAVSPEIGQAISGTMTADTLRELNKSLPPALRLRPAEISSVEENGWSGYGATILSKKVAEKVAEQQALMPGQVDLHRQKSEITAQYNPETADNAGYGNSLQGRAYDKWLTYQNKRQSGVALTAAETADEAAAKRILETPQTRIDPETGQLVGVNPEPLGGEQGINSPASPDAAQPAAQPKTGGLFGKTDLATGIVSGIREVIAKGPGQEFPSVANPDVIQARQEFTTASNSAIRALTVNSKYPVGEMENVRKQFGMEPSVFDSPVNLRNRMVSIDSSLATMIDEQHGVIADPKADVERKKDARQKIQAMEEYRSLMGVPPEVKTDAEFNALPQGAMYRDGGKIYKKGAK